MSYDLAFWEGSRPADDAAAAQTYQQIVQAIAEAKYRSAPRPVIQALIRELGGRWPANDPDSPWAYFPPAAIGGVLQASLTPLASEQDIRVMASIALALELTCFDPQRGKLL